METLAAAGALRPSNHSAKALRPPSSRYSRTPTAFNGNTNVTLPKPDFKTSCQRSFAARRSAGTLPAVTRASRSHRWRRIDLCVALFRSTPRHRQRRNRISHRQRDIHRRLDRASCLCRPPQRAEFRISHLFGLRPVKARFSYLAGISPLITLYDTDGRYVVQLLAKARHSRLYSVVHGLNFPTPNFNFLPPAFVRVQ